MRASASFTFHKLEGSYQEFPNADTITRRLKKLVQTIVKEQQSLKTLNFTESVASENEPTGWSLLEKQHILELVTDFGIPITAEGKNDWVLLREMLLQRMFKDSEPEKQERSAIEEKGIQSLEKFVQRLRIYSQQPSEDANSAADFDPDKDGFSVPPETAKQLYKNINLLSYIRRQLLASNAKSFNLGLTSLGENLQKHRTDKHAYLPESWKPEVHDKGLLYAVSENGFSVLEDLPKIKQYRLEEMDISSSNLRKRLEFLCEFYWNFSFATKVVKKRKAPEKPEAKPEPVRPKKKHSKVQVERDERGNIIFPIVINNSLQILSLGHIDPEKNYHTEK
eukprot:TRINITY_DN4774_c0_g3_i2.p1 TRINITY_DN4774_c0_g3~~TRINITY_DN4774_c0_g3_i2.p1  ORF type:complete len:373 (+),score=142.08 TRINITY_DN4774_c0_g3_i2:110-1120(+)